MTEAESISVDCSHLLEILVGLAWCKQEGSTLVAVHKCTPEFLSAMHNHPVKAYPSGMFIKLNKSLVHQFQQKFDEGEPLPVVLVWKHEGLEIWYRRHNPNEFPYDSWSNPSASAAEEKERVLLPAADFGARFPVLHTEIAGKVKVCPTMIPPY